MFEVKSWTCRISDGSCVPRPVTALTDPGSGRVLTSLQDITILLIHENCVYDCLWGEWRNIMNQMYNYSILLLLSFHIFYWWWKNTIFTFDLSGWSLVIFTIINNYLPVNRLENNSENEYTKSKWYRYLSLSLCLKLTRIYKWKYYIPSFQIIFNLS